jgi:hypothetical protein
MTPARSPSLLLHPPLAAIYLRGKRAAAGVPVEYECCEGTIHGFMNMGRVLRTAHGWAPANCGLAEGAFAQGIKRAEGAVPRSRRCGDQNRPGERELLQAR